MNASWVRGYLEGTARTARHAAEGCAEDVAAAAELLVNAVLDGGKILICGNGGSAADSQGLATEFVSTLTLDNRRPAIPALALTTDTSVLTAVANDFGFEGVFARQVEALGHPGDVLVGISTSGNSEDVVRAFEQAAAQSIHRVLLSGATGGRLASLADVAILIPSGETSHIQEGHLAVEHALAFLVERTLYPRG